MQLLLKKFNERDFYTCFLTPLFFFLLFLYVWLKIDPVLYYQNQEPVFFLDSNFFSGFLAYPGGIVEYISLFLSQSFYYSWLGSIIITLVALLISLAAQSIIKSVNNGKQVQILHLVPAVLLIVLHSQYKHPFSLDIGLLISLGVFSLYYRTAPSNNLWRLSYYLVLSIILYYIAAGFFFLFTLLSVIYELSVNRRYYISASFLLISAIIPYVAKNYFFIINIKNAYTYLLTTEDTYKPQSAPYILFLFFPVIMILTITYNKLIPEKVKGQILKILLQNGKLRYVTQVLVIIVGSFILLNSSFDEENNTFLRIDSNAKNGNWNEVLKLITPEILNNKIVLCQLNRALYHTGQLSSEMFSYPQRAGTEGLIFSEDIAALAPLLRSDILFDLGHINEAQHWAFEAIAGKGYSPWILQRIALTSILKGNDQLARKCLNMLNKTLLFGSWAKHYIQILNDKTLISKDIQLRSLYTSMPKFDFIVLPDNLGSDLESILHSSKNNKMAYEYLMASFLLKHQLRSFITYINKLPEFGYKSIPRHYEEALLAYASIPDNKDFNLQNYRINPKTYYDFQDLEKTLRSFQGDKMAAYNSIMAKFGNTYWAYLLYN